MTIIEDGMLCITIYKSLYDLIPPLTEREGIDYFEIYTNNMDKFYRVFNMCTECLVMPLCVDIDQHEDGGGKIDIKGPCQKCKNIVDDFGF